MSEYERLDSKWVSENAVVGQYPDGMGYIVPAYKLQKLLVPKQELPVIPKFVAEWIKETKPYNSLRVAFEYIAQRKRDNHDDELALWVEEGNSEAFARAWLDGYTVEEPKYVIDLDDEEFSDGNHYLKRLEMSVNDVNIIAGDSSSAMAFESEEEAQLIADYVGGRVKELEE